MYQSAYDRMLASNLREFEPNIKQTVERNFPRMLEAFQAGEVEIPIIGGELPPPEYRTSEYFTELQAKIVRASCAKKWCESECPSWLNPVPLREEDCIGLLNIPDDDQRWGRNWLRSEYGRHLRNLSWHYERAVPFEKFCAQKYNSSDTPTSGVRKKRGRPRKLWAPNRRMI
jgi:hypothetical protein